jgi:uncharacterized phage protein gp47/JayE
VVPGTGLRYKVKEKVIFAENSAFEIPVEAEFPGLPYNISPGTAIKINRVINGLESVSVGEGWIESPGQETEDDNLYRARIESRWKSQILGNIKEVYKFYAETVDGVRAAYIVRAPRGPGSTDVVIASVIGLPNEELIHKVEEALYQHELMSFDVQVCVPVVEEVDVEIEYSGDVSENAIALVVEKYVYELGVGGRFAIKDLYDQFKIMKLPTIEILSPPRDVQTDGRTIIVANIRVAKI